MVPDPEPDVRAHRSTYAVASFGIFSPLAIL